MTDQDCVTGTPTAEHPVTVVLVEDHAQVRELITGQLTRSGIEVLDAVGTVNEGHHSIREHRPDIAVLDNHLPDGLGIDLCRRLTRDDPDLTVIIYSAQLTSHDQDQARQAGATHVVGKSFTNTELIAAITTPRPRTDTA